MNSLRILATVVLLGLATFAARAQNVGIGTTAPTQQLDVNGNLRLRGLSGTGARLPQVQADGTLGLLSTPAGAGSAAASPVLLNPNPPLGTTGGTRLARNIEEGSGYAVQNMHNTAAVAGGILYVAGDNLVQSFDVSNPAQPTMLDQIVINSGQAIVVSGSRAYVGGFRNRNYNSDRYLHILDISQPAALALRDSLEVGGSIYALAMSGTSVYVAVANNGSVQLKRYETSAGTLAPTGAVGLPSASGAFSLAVQGSLACLTTVASAMATSGQLLVVDTSDPQSLTLRGAVAIPRAPHGLALNGTIAYVLTPDATAGNSGSLRLFDTSPTVPQPLTTIALGVRPSDIVLSGATAYVTNYGSSTLQVFDVGQPANPVFRGQATTSANPLGVASDGQVAYVISPYTLQAFQVNSVRPLGLMADGTLGVGTAPTLSVNGQQLGISGGNTVTLPGDNLGNHTATQQLVLASQGLKFSDGTTLATAPAADNLGNHTATRNLNLAGYQLVGQGGTTGLTITSAGDAGLGTSTPSQLLELGGQAAPTVLLHANSNNQVSGGTLQFRESDLKYGWNLRHNTGGSEEGSTTDRLVLERVNGSATSPAMSWDQNTGQVGIGTSAPAAALDVRGSVSVSEVLTTSALRSPTTGTHNLAPVAYGTFSGDGQLLNSSGNVTVQGSNGDYTLVINGSNTGNYVIMAFPFNSPFVGFGLCAEYRPYYINANGPFTNRVVTYKQGDSGLSAHGFNFVVFQP